MNFKVGDKAKVRNNLKAGVSFNGVCFVSSMERYKGEIHEIKEVSPSNHTYRLKGCNFWCFTDEMLELAENVSDEITINRYGNKVVAKMGKKVGVARCNETDTFDLYTGVKIATDRLFGKESEFKNSEVKEVKRHANVGEYIEIVRTTQGHIPNVCIGDIHKIKMVNSDGEAWSAENGFDYAEYVVLENYKPQEEPKEEKPKYYNGKTVCIRSDGNFSLFAVGKIYEFTDGVTKTDSGRTSSRYKSISEFNEANKNYELVELVE